MLRCYNTKTELCLSDFIVELTQCSTVKFRNSLRKVVSMKEVSNLGLNFDTFIDEEERLQQ